MAYEQLEELEARLASLGYSCVMQRPPLGAAGRGGVFRLEDWMPAAREVVRLTREAIQLYL